MLDRDGTLIVGRHHLSDPALVELLPQSVAGLRRLRDLGLGLVVVTNQSAVGRGICTPKKLDRIHRRLSALLAAEGISLHGIYHCPHTPEARCACRKPGTALVERAARELDFDPRASFMIGDNVCDIELGQNVGATTFLVRTGYGSRLETRATVKPDFTVDHLEAAARKIEELIRKDPANSESAHHAVN